MVAIARINVVDELRWPENEIWTSASCGNVSVCNGNVYFLWLDQIYDDLLWTPISLSRMLQFCLVYSVFGPVRVDRGTSVSSADLRCYKVTFICFRISDSLHTLPFISLISLVEDDRWSSMSAGWPPGNCEEYYTGAGLVS